MQRLIPLNTDDEDNAKTILSGYFKYGVATLIGGGTARQEQSLRNYMKILPLNTDVDGNAFCIRAQYYKMGWVNFIWQWGGALEVIRQRA